MESLPSIMTFLPGELIFQNIRWDGELFVGGELLIQPIPEFKKLHEVLAFFLFKAWIFPPASNHISLHGFGSLCRPIYRSIKTYT